MLYKINPQQISDTDIAIIGAAVRVPGARNVREFWRNLRDGVESVRTFTDEELAARGVPADVLRHPRYIKSGIVLEDMEYFDAEFFGFSPKEAAIMDPQHRHFLEVSWEALEDAAYTPESFKGTIGVYAGCGMGAYFMYNILSNPDLVDSVGLFLLRHTGNDKDFLPTRVSYLFNLTGPSVAVQTACSTSLVAAHVACQALLNGECDMALAGGVTIELPHYRGYMYNEGEILSPDGHCRAFDHRSQGTIFGSGAGVVVLRRLKDALRDGDHIRAIWKGSAINNDGAGKVGYLAPSVDGQASAMAEALALAGVSADSIGLVECHGTGTYVGDPIEVAALTQAWRQSTKRTGFCGIGSVKTNIGHLDTAAGVASLAKAVLALEHKQMPPSLNFQAPNPTIDFRSSPFYVNDRLKDWPAGEEPRRAAVNSLGVGGTNAFAIIEEAPAAIPVEPSKKPFQLFMLSARNRPALDAANRRLAEFLNDHPEVDLGDVAYTLYTGRRAFDQRRVFACRSRSEAIEILEANDPRRVFTHKVTPGKPSVVFMFPGGGAQYPNMGRDLYDAEPLFRELVDQGFDLLQPKVDFDVRGTVFPSPENFEAAAKLLQRPGVQLAPIFILEYALARLLMSWGVQPDALIGHSLGENTAACVAGVMSFPDALGLVTLRGQLFEKVPAGGMLSVPMKPEDLRPLLGDRLDLAVVNSPEFCVASGREEDVEALFKTLSERGVEAKRIPIAIAAHSRLLEPILADFGAYLRSIRLHPPQLPFLSNRTGRFITAEQATDPDYWVQHLRHTVHFGDGIGTLLETPGRVFIEVGPGKTLGSLAKQHPNMKPGQSVIATTRHPEEKISDTAYFLTALGQLWAAGVSIDLSTLWKGETRRRIPLPTYAFQRQKYWIEPGKVSNERPKDVSVIERTENLDDWFYQPVWRQTSSPRLPKNISTASPVLMFMDDAGVGERLAERLEHRGVEVLRVHEGDAYYSANESSYYLSPEQGREGYDQLVRDLVAHGKAPARLVHLWLVTANESFRPGSSFFHRNLERGFYSLFFLAQSMAEEGLNSVSRLVAVSNGMQRVLDEPLRYPEKATVLGPCKVIPREFPGIRCTSIDLTLESHQKKWNRRKTATVDLDGVVDLLEADVLAEEPAPIVAYRDGGRFEQRYERGEFPAISDSMANRIRPRGVYLITGGLGGIGLVTAEHLARVARAKLVLVSRQGLPPRGRWEGDGGSAKHPERVRRQINSVKALEALGAEVLVAAADVTDVEQMRKVVADARKRFGGLHGVIHAAGVLHDDLILVKTQAEVEEVFAPKVHGTLVLDSLLADADLDFFVLCSSTSAVTAPAGQIDYVAANAFLNAYAQHRAQAAAGLTVAVNWGVWNEIGMAADAAARMDKAGTESDPSEPPKHPLFNRRTTDGKGKFELTATMTPSALWILDEHRTRSGHAIFPGTGFIELARAALDECGETGPVEISDLYFFRPLVVGDEESKEVRVRLRRTDAGYTLDVQSRCALDAGRYGWETHAQCKLLLHALATPKDLPVATIDARCTQRRTPDDANGIRSRQEDFLRFGPRWRVLRQVNYGRQEAVARLALPERFAADLKTYLLHPALLDYATGFAMDAVAGYEAGKTLWVPVSYKSIRVHAPLTAGLVSWVRDHGDNRADREFVSFDIVIADARGRVLVEIEEFSMKRVTSEVDFAASRKPLPSELEMEPAADDAHASPAERAFRHNLSCGIRPGEGVEALTRVLGHDRVAEVVVSSLDLDALVKQAETLTDSRPGETSTAKFDRPTLDSEYVEPRDDIEKALVGFWEELLGVKSVGVRDSFFDLGGHSLIAVRLFAKIKKAFQVEYPISVLFEAPTVERCAELIRASLGTSDAPHETGATAPVRRYRHLVPMHPKDPGGRTPFFLIAGMFGNVLNLRHLAHLLGSERPFYGVQARGLYGDDQPHETFEEMAEDYLKEIRSVQANGPYLLGGFSGGGIAAFEMAQRLLADGEQVGALVLLDTPLPQSPPLSSTDKMQIHWQRLRRQGPSYLTEWARNRIAWELKKRNGSARKNGEMHPAEFRSEAIKDAFYRALPKYRMRYFASTITLFRPKLEETYRLGPGRVLNSQREFVFHDNGWGAFADRVDVHEVPGDHDSMVLEPNVRVLAQKLRACLTAAEASEPLALVT